MKELLKQIKSLDKNKKNYLIFQLLVDNDISYQDISAIYVEYLQNKDNKNRVLIGGLSIPLSYYWDKCKGKNNQDIFIKCKAAFNLLKSKMFHTAPIENEYINYLKKHHYSEDENGMHTFNK